jgi:ribosomal protein L16 Arg81 hydroxylase
MKTQDLFGDFPLERFFAEHLYRLPLALPNVCQSLSGVASWPLVGVLVGAADADVMVVRQGERYEGASPTDLASAQALCAKGYTIVVRHAERHDDSLRQLAEAFAETFQAPVNLHVYATPPGSFGFSWHYDAEDVFILQTTGEKEYLLRKNTVNPWPLEETLPADMQYERELMPLMRVLLQAGDLLYIPCGYWHRAEAAPSNEVAISLAVGVMSRSAMDVFDLLRAEALQSLVWRQRLPLFEAAGAESNRSSTAYKHILSQLATDISRTLTSSEFLARLRSHFRAGSHSE